ncbi:hypothetical protein K0M31_001299 [Melipona bicolor]|uniref:Uncharacterized protein n=1 Tax=Melipona bicolor TaxID=60889 RepID=A0AA40GFJ7_9HYME|nr:hypothetical protein K0M31_001299 [Melipona bicolor]
MHSAPVWTKRSRGLNTLLDTIVQYTYFNALSSPVPLVSKPIVLNVSGYPYDTRRAKHAPKGFVNKEERVFELAEGGERRRRKGGKGGKIDVSKLKGRDRREYREAAGIVVKAPGKYPECLRAAPTLGRYSKRGKREDTPFLFKAGAQTDERTPREGEMDGRTERKGWCIENGGGSARGESTSSEPGYENTRVNIQPPEYSTGGERRGREEESSLPLSIERRTRESKFRAGFFPAGTNSIHGRR